MKRPNSLAIVGAVWFLFGLLAYVGEAAQGKGVQIPDTNLVNMLIGAGLLNGWRICYWYAKFMSGLGFVIVAAFLPWAVFHTSELVYNFPFTLLRDQRPHEMMSPIAMALLFAIWLGLSGWMYLVLKREEVRGFFNRQPAAKV